MRALSKNREIWEMAIQLIAAQKRCVKGESSKYCNLLKELLPPNWSVRDASLDARWLDGCKNWNNWWHPRARPPQDWQLCEEPPPTETNTLICSLPFTRIVYSNRRRCMCWSRFYDWEYSIATAWLSSVPWSRMAAGMSAHKILKIIMARESERSFIHTHTSFSSFN